MPTKYAENIMRRVEAQEAKGLNKYGIGLEQNPAEIMERLEHLAQELTDGLQYVEWLKDYLAKLE